MALTYTPERDSGARLPAFRLPGTDGKTHSSTELEGSAGALVMFICNHCPYVKAIESRLVELGETYFPRGIKIMAISSNDASNYPDDSFEKMKLKNYPFPYLFDESQDVAKSFGAVCTPDFFLYDATMTLAYRGRLDDSWKDASQVNSRELYEAMDAILEGRKPSSLQKPSMGCNIKWKATSCA